jgi:hypothetical protein
MASQVLADGTIAPPLNIAAPAPLINLRGFNWTTVDEKFHLAQLLKDGVEGLHTEAQLSSGQQQSSLVNTKPSSLLTAQAPPVHLPVQLEKQLLPKPDKPPPALPVFPLEQFQGTYAGNGFNTIFRPRGNPGVRDSADEQKAGLGQVST